MFQVQRRCGVCTHKPLSVRTGRREVCMLYGGTSHRHTVRIQQFYFAHAIDGNTVAHRARLQLFCSISCSRNRSHTACSCPKRLSTSCACEPSMKLVLQRSYCFRRNRRNSLDGSRLDPNDKTERLRRQLVRGVCYDIDIHMILYTVLSGRPQACKNHLLAVARCL